MLQEAAVSRTSAPPPPAATQALDRASRTEALSPTTTGSSRRTRRGVWLLALLLAALVAVVLVALLNGSSPDNGSPNAGSPTGTPSHSSSHTATQSQSPSQSQKGEFRTYSDPTGFSIDVPRDWTVSHEGTQTRFTDPSEPTRHLLVDQTDHPKKDPKQDWEKQEKSVSERLPNYHRISIESVDYRDWPAADWTFTYGQHTEVVNRGFVTGSKGYAIYIQGPRDSFDQTLSVFDRATASFQPAG
jgi:hypothetical protein